VIRVVSISGDALEQDSEDAKWKGGELSEDCMPRALMLTAADEWWVGFEHRPPAVSDDWTQSLD
jgi:hypothetical protein